MKILKSRSFQSLKTWILCFAISGSFLAHPATASTLIISGKKNVIIANQSFSNPNGDCVQVTNSSNIQFNNVNIGPCKGNGILVSNSKTLTIVNSTIHNTTANGIALGSSSKINIHDNNFSTNQAGVYVVRSTSVKVDFNNFLNPQGPIPRGQFVQFNGVTGPDNEINCNIGENILGQGNPIDSINIYKSYGTASSPIKVVGNKIKGGGPNKSGGGIMLGDNGGGYITADSNIVVNPGQYGIAVANGTYITMSNNKVFGVMQPFTNVGMYVWSVKPELGPCANISVIDNQVDYTNKLGNKNNFWNGKNCGPILMSGNDFKTPLSASIIDNPIPACAR